MCTRCNVYTYIYIEYTLNNTFIMVLWNKNGVLFVTLYKNATIYFL